ncbi:acid protease [Gloeophyllum trabeum ATCC 11539]|uniref:Acid protease n=1 Tax=Gloeophyllum trabeum (strain ATCC 11539 / FP-39264 / Madison 617) TaxID=670483 RepID=S7PTK6_GLOTA|nr:acid protease [Gloeophyllum trabeum ATCC 11539]EPQ51101.1 acid protease [Gloeophyllum trabeum ATCC 11539]
MFSLPLSLSLVVLLALDTAQFGLALPRKWEQRQLATETEAQQKRWGDVPIMRQRKARRDVEKRSAWGNAVGLGDSEDLFYSVALMLGNTTTAFNLDTGSSDLWVVSSACQTGGCEKSTWPQYPLSTFEDTGADVLMQYGDSTTGTSASGPVGRDTVTLAGLSIQSQPFAAVNKTDSSVVVDNDAAGIFGLGFPSESQVQAAVVNQQFNTPKTTDEFVSTTSQNGPLLSRLAMTGQLAQPMFTITLQRDTIDVGGNPGVLTIGKLPDGVDNSSLTWVPVKLYSPADGGLNPPTFAPNEIYPLRWEVELDAVYLDGQKLADSAIKPSGVQSTTVSALIDTGNSILRGPEDVVNTIFSTVSPTYNPASANSVPAFPCGTPHTLAFQIGGKMFPVDPRDFVVQQKAGDASNCYAGNLVSTDPPSVGGLFSWSLGDPFFKSNLIAFYYGNLTHPSQDPPRIGFMSTVPSDASTQLQQVVSSAQNNGGKFASTSDNALAATANVASTTYSMSASATPASTTGGAQASQTESSKKKSAAKANFGCADSVGVAVTALASISLLLQLI